MFSSIQKLFSFVNVGPWATFTLLLLHCSTLPPNPQQAQVHVRVAADHPFYLNFSFDPTLRFTARLPVAAPGNYEIVLGANRPLPAKFAPVVSVTLNGNQHREIPYGRTAREGRVFLVLRVSVREGDPYRGGYLDCHLSFSQKGFQAMTPAERALFQQSTIEFGFGKAQ